jgi:hypothetical protein
MERGHAETLGAYICARAEFLIWHEQHCTSG